MIISVAAVLGSSLLAVSRGLLVPQGVLYWLPLPLPCQPILVFRSMCESAVVQRSLACVGLFNLLHHFVGLFPSLYAPEGISSFTIQPEPFVSPDILGEVGPNFSQILDQTFRLVEA
jgi:hypothetical protein